MKLIAQGAAFANRYVETVVAIPRDEELEGLRLVAIGIHVRGERSLRVCARTEHPLDRNTVRNLRTRYEDVAVPMPNAQLLSAVLEFQLQFLRGESGEKLGPAGTRECAVVSGFWKGV